MATDLKIRNWAAQPRKALSATQLVAQLSRLDGWTLDGDGASVAIVKTFHFGNYFETIAFVNAVALIAHRQDHHPDLAVHYNRCGIRFNTHDVGGISNTDFECAALVDALLQ